LLSHPIEKGRTGHGQLATAGLNQP
uniref:Transposase n=1 Tax=Globodera pallida TaxID=36090 RepID=A0A183C6W3_GLOPA